MPKTIETGEIPLISIDKDKETGVIHTRIATNNFKGMSGVSVGLLVADLVHHLEEALGTPKEDILRGLRAELESPTDQPKEMQLH